MSRKQQLKQLQMMERAEAIRKLEDKYGKEKAQEIMQDALTKAVAKAFKTFGYKK